MRTWVRKYWQDVVIAAFAVSCVGCYLFAR